jgi:diguanylate cyclase (GGDEF)-like protein
MLIDLDHFKAINDTLGHHVGDQVIRAAGAALRHSLRADDIVARIGGDEFAVLLPGADRDRAEATADRLVHAVATEARVDDLHGGHGVGASVGVAMLEGRFAKADDALMAADLAMYDAKHAGRRRTSFYEDGEKSSTQSRLQWVDRIRCALAEERLALWAQPIVDLETGGVQHEILLRMIDTEGELIAPGEFLPIAEQFGLMGEIDRWVVTQAIARIAEHSDRELVFEINLSGSSFAYVKHLPFDYLKIDGEFVRHSATSPSDRVILESLIHAARGLGKRTIAEYVEDEETAVLLRELGVDMVQGFHTGRPRPLEAVIAAAPMRNSGTLTGDEARTHS